MAKSANEWMEHLSTLSPAIRALKIPRFPPDLIFWREAPNQPVNELAYNLSESTEHNNALARWIEKLLRTGASETQAAKLLGDLTRNTYGTFSELAAYGTLLDACVPFEMQVPVTGKDILNPNGSEIDGRIILGADVLFDIKAFGLHEHLSNTLSDRLSKEFKKSFVAIEGSGDAGIDEMTIHLSSGYRDLVTELQSLKTVTRGALTITVKPVAKVQMSVQINDPYELASNNARYAFKFAKQFAKRKPFVLIFVLHPWLGGFRLTTSRNDAAIFFRSFSRRTFMQFRRDRLKTFNVTIGHASRLISGLMFLNVWPAGPNQEPTQRLFVNPYAKHPITEFTLDALQISMPNLTIDSFRHDAY